VLDCRQIAALMLGLIAAAWLALAPGQPHAESRIETSISPPPVLKPRVPARRPAAEPPAEEIPDTAAPERRPADRAEEAEEDGDETGQRPRPSPMAAGDGDLGAQAETQAPLDGIIAVDEPMPVTDGVPNPRKDARTPGEIIAFEGPPAGYSPYLFQIELEPLADRRTAELFRLEPYVARGIRIGSFVVFPEAEIGALVNNNVFRSPSRHADDAFEARSTARMVSDWRAHAVEFRASGLASFYQEFPSENDRAYSLEARGRLDLTKSTNIEALVLHQLDKDIRSARDAPVGAAERGDIETNRVAVALNHRFNRLSLQLRGSVTDVDFAPVPSIGGGLISNDERDFTQREIAFRASWAIKRMVDVFAETAANDREFHVAPADGILRTSHGERYRVGVTFGPWDTRVRGEVSVGWGLQRPNDRRLGEIEGVIVDANLAWRATPLTTFLLTARSEFIDTTATGSAGALSRQVGLEARHAFRRHLTGVAGVKYVVSPYDGIALNQRELTAELGLDYYLGRDTIVFGRVQHIVFESTTPASDYTADIVRIGVRVRQ
jgi:hypothetical protein